MHVNIPAIIGVARYELRREVKKRSFYFLVFLVILPVIMAGVIRVAGLSVSSDETLWAVALGLKTQTAATGQLSLLELQGIANWAWLVALFYGGDLFASDLREGAARLLLSRPVKRWEYILGKLLSLTILMAAAFGAAGITAVIAGWIVSGPQSHIALAPVLSAVLGVGILPLALTAALIGMKMRSPTLGVVLGFVVYIVVSIGLSIGASIEAARETGIDLGELSTQGPSEDFIKFQAAIVEKTLKYYSYIPILAGFSLPSMLYWEAMGGVVEDPILTMVGLEIEAGGIALAQALSLCLGIAAFTLAIIWLMYRMDL